MKEEEKPENGKDAEIVKAKLVIQVFQVPTNPKSPKTPSAANKKITRTFSSANKNLSHVNSRSSTKIQCKSLPYTLKGRDIIGLAETGSGKTLAFAMPILQSLLESPTHYYAMVISPTR